MVNRNKLSFLVVMGLFMVVISACSNSVESISRPTLAPKPTSRPTSAPKPTLRPTSPKTTSKAWYEGGTLHCATVEEWLRATDDNRLATAADWVARLSNVGLVWETETEARLLASELENCVSGAAEGMTETGYEELDKVGLET